MPIPCPCPCRRRWRRPAFVILPVIALLLAAFSASGRATAAGLYSVEVLVFAYRQPSSQTELWLGDDEQVALDQRLLEFQSRAAGIDPLAGSGARLGTLRSRLEADPQFQVLYHGSWQQPSEPLPEAQAVEISEPGIGISPDLVGYVRVYVARELIYADLLFRLTPFSTEQSAAAGATMSLPTPGATSDVLINPDPRYYIDEKRRLRFGELHYFDHPRFGVVLTVEPSADDGRANGVPAADLPASDGAAEPRQDD